MKIISEALPRKRMDSPPISEARAQMPISESSQFTGSPVDIEQLINQLDLYTPPEIIIYKDHVSEILFDEFYRVPIYLDFYLEESNFACSVFKGF